MQGLARISVLRPVFATVLILAFVVIGLYSVPRLGIDRFPNVDFPVVTVTTTLPGATPEEMDTDVTEEIEKQVGSVSGIDSIQSVSSEGVAVTTIQFVLERNGDVAAQDVRAKVDLALPNLPENAERPIVQKFGADASPILNFTLNSDNASIRDLTEYADKTLRPQLESLNGVGQVQIVGGRARQINVLIDPYKLRALNLTAIDIRRALQSQNLQVPGGAVDQGTERISVRTQGRVTSIQELKDLVMVTREKRAVRLSDVALVEDGEEEATSIANVNGKPAVLLQVRKQSGANTIAVIDAVKAKLKEVAPTLPSGYSTQITTDQSVFVRAALHAVQEHLILGSVLAAAVVLVFLLNWRSTLISALAIPASIISTFALIYFAGFTLNVITLLALTLAVGIVIDDAIVVLENIYRFIEEKGMSGREAAIEGTKEIGLAVLATTLSLVAIFAPVALMSGIVGRFLSSFGLTMAFAILVSLVVAFTITPMLSARLLKAPTHGHEGEDSPVVYSHGANGSNGTGEVSHNGHHQAGHGGVHHQRKGFFSRIEDFYTAVVRFSLRRRWIVIVLCVVSFFMSGPLVGLVPKNFLPDDDQSELVVSVRASEGRNLAATTALLNDIAKDIQQLPEVQFTVVTVGNDPQQTQNKGEVYVKMNEVADRKTKLTQFDLMAKVRTLLKEKYPPELRTLVSPPAAFGGGAQAGIMFYITGPDLDTLAKTSQNVTEGLRKVPGVADVDTSLVLGKPELGVTIERARAADLGVLAGDVASTFRILVAGEDVSDYPENGERYDINLRALPSYRNKQSSLSLFSVPAASQTDPTVNLDQLVRFQKDAAPSAVNRYGRQRSVTITANVTPGTSQQTVLENIQRLFKEQNLGPQYQAQFGGQSRELGRSFASLGAAFLLAFAFMYLILAAQFESWIHPVTILLSLPLTIPFALASLLITGNSLNIYSVLGILVLFGIVKKNSILQVDHANGLRATGMERNAAVIQACRDRLRPILMTTIAFVAGMLPLALSTGTGAGTNRATSGVIIGGQVLSLALTLVATPVIYTLFDDMVNLWNRLMGWIARRFQRGKTPPTPRPPERRPDGERERSTAAETDHV
jgi:HAE1 family hydrophobic/amphiphilic exporter-1